MAVQLNRTIVAMHDKNESAAFLSRILGVGRRPPHRGVVGGVAAAFEVVLR